MTKPTTYEDGTMVHEYFECLCESNEHLVRVNYFVDEFYDLEEDGIYVDLHLNSYERWYKRVWLSLKYIFGFHCKYGHWDSWILKRQDAEKFRNLLDRYINSGKTLLAPMRPHKVDLPDGRRVWVLAEEHVPEEIKASKLPIDEDLTRDKLHYRNLTIDADNRVL